MPDKNSKKSETTESPVADQSTQPVLIDKIKDALNNTSDADNVLTDYNSTIPSERTRVREQIPTTGSSTPVAFNPEEYSDYVSDPNSDNPHLDFQRAMNQSGLEQTGHALTQLGASIVGGFATSAGVALNLKEGLKTALGTEKEYQTGWLYDWGNDLMQKAQENFPIYQKREPTPDKAGDLSDPAYWLNLSGPLGFSIGAMAQSMGETALVGLATEGAGLEAEIPEDIEKASVLSKIFKNQAGTLTNTQRLKNNALLYGTINRHNMSVMCAVQTYQETYKDLIDRGVDPQKAKETAAQGAALDYKLNMPMAFSDAVMLNIMTFNLVTKQGTGALEQILEHIPSAGGKYAAKTGIETLLGGVEGGWQQKAQDLGQDAADQLAGIQNIDHNKEEMQRMTVHGALLGAIFPPIGEAYNHMTESAYSKSTKMQHADFIKNVVVSNMNILNEIHKATEEGNIQKANNLRAVAGVNQALGALHLDHILNTDAAFPAYIGNLQNTLDIANSNDPDKIQTAGLDPNSIQHIQTEVPKYIEDAQKIQHLYNTAKETVDPSAVVPIVSRQYYTGVLHDILANTNANIADLESKIPDFDKLSTDGQFMFNAKYKIEALNENERRLVAAIPLAQNDAEKEGLANALEEVRKDRLTLKNTSDIISADPTRYTPEERGIIAGLPEQKELLRQHIEKGQLEASIDQNRKELEVWNRPDFQKANNEKKVSNLIDKANTEEEIAALQGRINDNKSGEAIDKLIKSLKDISGYTKKDGSDYDEEQLAKIDSNPLKHLEHNLNYFKELSTQEGYKKFGLQQLKKYQKIQDDYNKQKAKENNSLQSQLDKKKEEILKKKRTEDLSKVTDGQVKPTTLTESIEQAINTPEEPSNITEPVTPLSNVSEERKNIIKDFPFGKPVGLSDDDVKQTDIATVISEDPNDALFEPKILTHSNDEYKALVKQKTAAFYESMKKDNGVAPTFKELVQEAQSIVNNKTIDEMYNVFKLGWESNDYAKTNFDQVYKELLSTTKDLARDLINFAPTGWGVSNPYYQAPNNLDKNTDTNSQDNDQEENIEKTPPVINPTGYKTSQSTLKLAYLHRPYEVVRTELEGQTIVEFHDIGQELYQPNDVDSKFIMHPDSLPVGSKITIKVADNAHEIPVGVWNTTTWERGKAVQFSNWMTDNGVTEGSDEHIGKVPIFVYVDGQKKPIAMIHDVEWYNPTNIGAATEEVQKQLIKESREELMNLRRKVLSNNGNIEATIIPHGSITGQKFELTEEEKTTVNEANPQAMIGYVTGPENIRVSSDAGLTDKNGKPTTIIESSQLINTKQFRPGQNYDIRRWRTDDNGNPNYIALEVDRNKLTTQAQSSVVKAIHTYLAQHTTNPELKKELKAIRDGILQHTSKANKNPDGSITNIPGHDLFTKEGLQNYISQFVHVLGGNFGEGDVVSKKAAMKAIIDATDGIKPHTPVIIIEKGAVYITRKGEISKSILNSQPVTSDKITPAFENIQNILLMSLHGNNSYSKIPFISEFYQNVSGKHLDDNRNMAFINVDDQYNFKDVTKGESYHDYLKNNMKTNVKSFNVGTEKEPVWATAYQPVINFTYEGQWQPQVQETKQKKGGEQMFMLKDEIWKEATTPEERNLVLSLSDVEKRLGRKLILDDFHPDAFVNDKNEQVVKMGYKSINFDLNKKRNSHDIEDLQESIKKSNKLNKEEGLNKIKIVQDSEDGLTPEEKKKIIDRLKAKYGISDSDSNHILHEPGYEKDTDQVVRNASKKLISIEELNTTNKSQLVRFIARKIEAMIDVKYKAKIDMSSINDIIKNSFEEIFKPKELSIQSKIDLLKEDLTPEELAIYQKQLDNIDIVRRNYDALINEAKQKEIFKYTGITEVKQSKREIIGKINLQREEELELAKSNKLSEEEIAKINSRYDEQINKVKGKTPLETVSNEDAEEVKNEDRNIQENDEDNIAEQGDEREANYNRTSLEENSKASVNNIFKRFLAQIPTIDNKGNVKRGFLGIEEYPGFDFYFNKLQSMLTSPTDVQPSFKLMIDRLEEYRGKQPWVGVFIDRMKSADEQMKNGFVSSLCLHGTNTNFVMFSENKKTNKKNIKVYQANANEMLRQIHETWYQQFNQSKLVDYHPDGSVSINTEHAQKLLDQFHTWKFDKKKNIDTLPKLLEASKWLENFGITLLPESLRELLNVGYWVDENEKPVKYSYNKMFSKSANTAGLFGLLAHKLQMLVNLAKEGSSTDFDETESLHPLHDISGGLDKVANIQKTFDAGLSTNSHRDGQKSIFDLTPSKLIAQEVAKLLNDEVYRQQKLSITFDKQSYLLNLVNQFDGIRRRVMLNHGAINILKEQGKKNFTDTELNTLSDKDQEYVRVGMFMDMQQGKEQTIKFNVGDKEYELPMRIATMMFPVMSDKKININLRMPILNFSKGSFTYNIETKRIANSKIITTDEFKTWDLGQFEGRNEKQHEEEIDDYTINHPDEPIGKTGESFNQFKHRVLTAFQKLLKEAPDGAMILTHSSVLKIFNIWNRQGRPTANDFKIDPKEYVKESTQTGTTEPFESEHGTLFVSRHGETDDNKAGNLRSANTQLTEKGIEQAKKIGTEFKDKNIPVIYSSSLDRAIHTSNLLLDEADGTHVEGTKEVHTVKGLQGYVEDFAFSQLIKPELDRIISHHARAKSMGISPDILVNQNEYNKGAQIFHMLVKANNTMYKDEHGQVLLLQYIADNAQQLLPGTNGYNELIKNVKQDLTDTMNGIIEHLVEEKINKWKENDFFLLNSDGSIKANKELNQGFLDNLDKTDSDLAAHMAAYTYIVNNLITTANMHMIFDGDIANYSKDKGFNDKTLFEDGCPFKPLSKEAYYKISKGITDVNLGKRLAMMIASGKFVGDAVNDKYLQLFLKDQVTHSSNISYLLDLFHPDERTEEVNKWVEDLKSNNPKVYNDAIKGLSKKFEDIADYFKIESTDAQEYTTAKEALDLIFKQGRMSVDQYKILSNKIKTQKQAEREGKEIPKDAYLTDKETKLVFTPMKPVYTDISPNLQEDNSRVMYIKSSSFPLLAQFTKGTQLDGLRKAMEELEDKSNYNVRASYNTANKVGAVLPQNQLQVWDNNGDYIPNSINADAISSDLKANGTTQSAMILNRENFRIQQDVPFKAGKNKSDKTSIGTQTMKELFSDGVAFIKDKIFDYNGTKVDGKTLLGHYNDLHVQWLANEKSLLYDDLGINEVTGRPNDIVETTNKLQQVLVEEATKRGYPIQDLEALELKFIYDNQGKPISSEFIVPLCLLPNSNRYEALLNAIVSNRLSKLKMPGNAFVVGSEAGFKFQTNLQGINQSKVVYTSSYDDELKAAYIDKDGVFHKAQVMVRSTFRNAKGELIDLTDSKYSTRDAQGKLVLKEEMIDKELRSLTSFRIPTTGHCSMSQVEIVGFLPIECADLMIVPKNFTKQKGLDFDVDKENTYQLHSRVDNQTGQIRTLQAYKPLSEIEDGDLKTKLIQNEIIKIHQAILGNADNRIQRKINRVLSLDFAREQAELIEKLNEKNENYTTYTPLSDEYQKSKMALGAAGKTGIGIYANYMVTHALAQQVEVPLSLMTKVFNEETEKIERVPLKLKIGKLQSDGILGKEKTLDGSRSIADVYSQDANTATDNEKEQIMGRMNINDLTINVNSILAGQGYDKVKLDNGKEIDLRGFLLSQPIIKDYVELMKKSKSLLSDFDRDIKSKIQKELYAKYGGDIFETETMGVGTINSLSPEEIDEQREKLTGQTLYDNINKPDNKIQQAVFHLFNQIDEYSDAYTTMQGKLNIQKSGLGKSAFEMLEKYNNAQWFNYNDKIDNIHELIGDYVTDDEFKSRSTADMVKDGYTVFENFAVKPTTPIGAILVNTTKSGFELWSGFFPYTNSVVDRELTSISKLFGDDLREKRRIEIKQDIFSELKKYLFSSNKLNLFTGNPQDERKRLFFDKDGNESLASYMNKLSRSEEFGDIIKNNKLLSQFSYVLNGSGSGLPSLVKYNNADSEDFNEEYKYQALVELMDAKAKLPDYNGVTDYNTRKLARDLINYTYLSGGVQKAIEFVKYVPIPYLQEIGFSDVVQKWQQAANDPNSTVWNSILGTTNNEDAKWNVSRFAMQYVQHNPERVQSTTFDRMLKSSIEYQSGKTLGTIMSFEIRDEASPKQFVRVYNKDIKNGNKNQLYMYDGKKYNRIPTLGTFGMSEYSIKDLAVKPLILQIINKKPLEIFNNSINIANAQLPTAQGRETLFDLNKGNLKETLNQISKADISNISALTKLILPYVRNIPLTIENIDGGRGQYKYDVTGNKLNDAISLDKNYLNDKLTTDYMVARTILHETIHSITAKELSKYFNKDGSLKVSQDKLPAHVLKLQRIFSDVQEKMSKEIAELKDYYASKDNKDKGTLQKEDDRLAYGALNIFEFTAMIMSEPEFQTKMATFKYRATDKNFLEQFIDAIKDILERVGIDFSKDSLAAHGIDAAMKLIDDSNEKQKSETFTKIPDNPFAKFGVSDRPGDINDILKISEEDIFKDPLINNETEEDWKKKENKSPCPF